MQFSLLLADADNTLFDFHAAEHAAFFELADQFALPDAAALLSLYSRINQSHWDKLHRGETTPQRIRLDRFEDFRQAIGRSDLSAEELNACYIEALGRQHILLDGALEFVQRISAHMPVCIATNGFSSVQRSRFAASPITPYIKDLLISEEIGESKPHPKMLLEGLSRFSITDKTQAVMIGDNEHTDIAAAVNAGIQSILFTLGDPPPAHTEATKTAATLQEAADWILGDTAP